MDAKRPRETHHSKLNTQHFSWPVRVYYEDTDLGGVVYYANYLKFMERARTEWLRALGFEQTALARDHGAVFVVSSLTIDYFRACNTMKHVCVASQNWGWREARCSQYVDIGKPSDKASADCGRNPLRAGTNFGS